MRTRPRAIARRRSARASFREGKPESVTALRFVKAKMFRLLGQVFEPRLGLAEEADQKAGDGSFSKTCSPSDEGSHSELESLPSIAIGELPAARCHLPRRPTIKLTFG